MILSCARLCFNDALLRAKDVGKTFNGNKMFVTLASVLQQISGMLFHKGSAAFTVLDHVPVHHFRSLDELLVAGYQVHTKVGDPFTTSESQLVVRAMRAYVVELCVRLLHCVGLKR